MRLGFFFEILTVPLTIYNTSILRSIFFIQHAAFLCDSRLISAYSSKNIQGMSLMRNMKKDAEEQICSKERSAKIIMTFMRYLRYIC